MKLQRRVLRLLIPSAVLLQITACFGPDPQFFFTATVANALVTNVVTGLFNLVFGGLGGAAA
ncbi:MAG: hypothetical protein D6744_11760 [Planctomycetota bacterium]|nr:MAG: hypothetical protein D6744_11760 [Planctomycetota bacterium]